MVLADMKSDKMGDVFKSGKIAFADDGFTAQVMRQLPAREPIWPVLTVAVFALASLALCLAGCWRALLSNLYALLEAASHLQPPPPAALATYAGIMVAMMLSYLIVSSE